jgi:hypothetical protein
VRRISAASWDLSGRRLAWEIAGGGAASPAALGPGRKICSSGPLTLFKKPWFGSRSEYMQNAPLIESRLTIAIRLLAHNTLFWVRKLTKNTLLRIGSASGARLLPPPSFPPESRGPILDLFECIISSSTDGGALRSGGLFVCFSLLRRHWPAAILDLRLLILPASREPKPGGVIGDLLP